MTHVQASVHLRRAKAAAEVAPTPGVRRRTAMISMMMMPSLLPQTPLSQSSGIRSGRGRCGDHARRQWVHLLRRPTRSCSTGARRWGRVMLCLVGARARAHLRYTTHPLLAVMPMGRQHLFMSKLGRHGHLALRYGSPLPSCPRPTCAPLLLHSHPAAGRRPRNATLAVPPCVVNLTGLTPSWLMRTRCLVLPSEWMLLHPLPRPPRGALRALILSLAASQCAVATQTRCARHHGARLVMLLTPRHPRCARQVRVVWTCSSA